LETETQFDKVYIIPSKTKNKKGQISKQKEVY